jgi:hypothetical protein
MPRKDRPLRPMMLPQKEVGKYGEIIKRLRGLGLGRSRSQREFMIGQAKSREEAAPESEAFAFGVALSTAPPNGGVTLEFCQ